MEVIKNQVRAIYQEHNGPKNLPWRNPNGKTKIQWLLNLLFQQCVDYNVASLQLMPLYVPYPPSSQRTLKSDNTMNKGKVF